MRARDKEWLSRSYASGDTFADTVDVRLPALIRLSNEVGLDLDAVAHGVRWWSDHLDGTAVTLISDHLVECSASVATNLVEARLHLLELQDFSEQEQAFVAQPLTYGRDGRPNIPLHPPRRRPMDDLPSTMTDLHITGFFRAVTSAFDCLGAVIVGVTGLACPILTASLKDVRNRLSTIRPADDGTRFLTEFGTVLERLVTKAGPTDWLPWVDQMRNMLVHRGRRFHVSSWEPRGAYSDLVGPDGLRVRMAWPVRHLPREPAVSDAMAMASGFEIPVLGEDMNKTVKGVMGSALALCDSVAHELVRAWRQRRERPGLVKQPPTQWPALKPTARSAFTGYDVNTEPFRPDVIVTSPEIVKRLVVTGNGTPSRS
jgi:hypothetical protein